MFRTTACAALALAALATTNAGAAPSCLTDPKGDVEVTGTPVPVDAPHLDLVRFSVVRSGRDLVATFHTAGGPGDGIWSMFFTFDHKSEYYVRARRNESLPPVARRNPSVEVYATLTQWGAKGADGVRRSTTRELTDVSAEFKAGAVQVRFPRAQLGAATPKAGAVPRVPWARARQQLLLVEYEDLAGCGFS